MRHFSVRLYDVSLFPAVERNALPGSGSSSDASADVLDLGVLPVCAWRLVGVVAMDATDAAW